MNLSYFYLLVIALISWWLATINGWNESDRTQAPAHSADYFSKGYTKWEMSPSGLLKSQVFADQMLHYSDDGTTHMTKPVMYSLDAKNPPWVIRSETGVLSADSKSLLLNGKVNLERAKNQQVKALTINTSNLKVNPETSYAETNQWAELISPPNRTTGVGMKLVYAQPIHLELLSQVKGKYETK
jgi:lipopolysaccharide export system protein LptC